MIKLIKKESNNPNTLFYFDPPYFLKGHTLYMNFYKKKDHQKIAQEIKKIKNMHWIVSYDNVKEINKLYGWVRNKLFFNILYTAYKTKIGKEVLFFSKELNINQIYL